MGHCFADLPSTSRFVGLMPRLLLPFDILLHCYRVQETGIYFVDHTKLVVCHNTRIRLNKMFRGLAQRGRTSMGCLFGFKLHLPINHHGQDHGHQGQGDNIDDRQPLEGITSAPQGKVLGDKEYIS